MIVANSTNVFRLLLSHWITVLMIFVILVALEFANDFVRMDRMAFSLAAVGLVVASLSIFLAFRVNESYARWWEARTLWGQLVNASRGFARQVTTLLVDEGAEEQSGRVTALQSALVYRQIAFVNALRMSLREENDWDGLKPFLSADDFAGLAGAQNKPAWLLQQQAVQLAEARSTGVLCSMGQNQLDKTFRQLHDVQGGCERIKNTAFPDKVAFVSRAIAWVMAITIAIAIMDPNNRFDPVDMVVVPVFMLSLILIERLGAELKNPFENEPNDTPMTALCRSIERDLRQVLGETELPPPLEPVNGVLM